MTNALNAWLYVPFLAVNLIIVISLLFGHRDRSSVFLTYVGFSAVLFVMQVLGILVHLVKSPAAVRFVEDAKTGVMALLLALLIMLVTRYYRASKGVARKVEMAWLGLCCVTFVIALTSPWHGLIRQSFVVTKMEPVTQWVAVDGVWMRIHNVLSVAAVLSAIVIVRVANRRLPASYKHGAQFCYSGMVLLLVCMLLDVSGVMQTTLDCSLLGASVCGLALYLGMEVYGGRDYLAIRHAEIYHYLEEPIFILDKNEVVVDANRAARKLAADTLKTKWSNASLVEFLKTSMQSGQIIRRQIDGQQDMDVVVNGAGYPMIYRVHSQPFFDEFGETNGRYLIMTDVTNNHLFMDRLRQLAGVDELTGLPNRAGYLKALRELDAPANLPLTVMAGDVNGLKEINDAYGHYEGDSLLKSIAEVLKRCMPKDGVACRIGGDAFMLLLPGCDESKAAALVETIHNALAEENATGEGAPSMALGFATKHKIEENINSMIHAADQSMQQKK